MLRDVHPTRVHLTDGVVKLNLIGMPYNFKKLIKDITYTGHLNYTAPELLRHKSGTKLIPAIDIWSLGCCFYALATKADPFTFQKVQSDSATIKKNIMECKIDVEGFLLQKEEDSSEQELLKEIMKRLLDACLQKTAKARPTAT